ncbi:MAG: alpha-L-fucosidase [Planctomycetota bacterium]|jgi:alpha-L-fucosidase
MKKLGLILVLVVILLSFGCQQDSKKSVKVYEPTWESIRKYKEVPEWLRDGKFGIYTHWGPYAVHAYGENTTWYSNAMYEDEESEARQHFEKNFGKLTPEYGYKDLIPKFTAEKFDADEWAELFEKAGAKFAGPVAEHHDGFAMWDTKYSDWNAAKMGPKRDVVGELEKAIKKRDMKYVVAFHHAANWFFFPVHDKNYDTGDPKNTGLYGQFHEPGEMRNQAFIDEWYDKIIEVIDNYSPDFIWFDFALDQIPEGYVKDFLAYYYNDATEKGKEVVVTYKGNDVVPGTGVRDLELGQEASITYHEWITDSTVDDRGAWGYADDLIFKSPNRVIDNLVDRVSKNGYLLLNVGPKPDGTIPEEARDLLLEVGKWLEINGDGIYGTTPWIIASEGPTNLGAVGDIGFNESNVVYTSKDIRFTVKGDNLYATFLDWPDETAVITTLRTSGEEGHVEKDWAGDSNVDDELKLGGKTIETGQFILSFKKGGVVDVVVIWNEENQEFEGQENEEFEGQYEQEVRKTKNLKASMNKMVRR